MLAEGSDVDRSGFLVPLGSSSLGFRDSFGFFLSSGSFGTALFGFFVGLFGQFMGCVMVSHPSSFRRMIIVQMLVGIGVALPVFLFLISIQAVPAGDVL